MRVYINHVCDNHYGIDKPLWFNAMQCFFFLSRYSSQTIECDLDFERKKKMQIKVKPKPKPHVWMLQSRSFQYSPIEHRLGFCLTIENSAFSRPMCVATTTSHFKCEFCVFLFHLTYRKAAFGVC